MALIDEILHASDNMVRKFGLGRTIEIYMTPDTYTELRNQHVGEHVCEDNLPCLGRKVYVVTDPTHPRFKVVCSA